MTTKISNSMLESPGGVALSAAGDVAYHNGTAAAALPVGANGTVLTVDTTLPGKIKWAAPSGGGGSHEVGDLKATARSTPPAGWLLCDGRLVSQTTYAALYAALGGAASPWGVEGSDFRLPDLSGRTPVGAGTPTPKVVAITAGPGIGVANATLTVAANSLIQTGTRAVFTGTCTGLVSGTTYTLVRVTATTVRLATSDTPASAVANAAAGTGLTFGPFTSGTFTLVADAARPVGQYGGASQHLTTVAEMPSHTHTIVRDTLTTNLVQSGFDFEASPLTGGATGATGGSQYADAMPPYAAVNWLVYAGV